MMNKERKISKYSPVFFLILLIPFMLCGWFAFLFEGDARLILLIVPFCLLGLTFIAIVHVLYRSNIAKLKRRIEGHLLNGNICAIIVDLEQNQIGLVFFWNPFENFILPAKNISKVWVDDCKRGFGIGCTERVCCRLIVDELRVSLIIPVNLGNRMLPMSHPKVRIAVSKAEHMVAIINQARYSSHCG